MRKISLVLLCCALPLLGCPDDKPAPDPANDSVAVADLSVAEDVLSHVELTIETDTGSPGDSGLEEVGQVDDTAVEAIVCLGSVYPDQGPIDPDSPVYSDQYYTQEQVTKMFAQAKADNTKAYQAYLAGYKYPDLLECAFCYCGCASPPAEHVSALDCFKDIHGFG